MQWLVKFSCDANANWCKAYNWRRCFAACDWGLILHLAAVFNALECDHFFEIYRKARARRPKRCRRRQKHAPDVTRSHDRWFPSRRSGPARARQTLFKSELQREHEEEIGSIREEYEKKLAAMEARLAKEKEHRAKKQKHSDSGSGEEGEVSEGEDGERKKAKKEKKDKKSKKSKKSRSDD